jgi:hypothetical protein
MRRYIAGRLMPDVSRSPRRLEMSGTIHPVTRRHIRETQKTPTASLLGPKNSQNPGIAHRAAVGTCMKIVLFNIIEVSRW